MRRDLVNVCTSFYELFADLHSAVMAGKMHRHKLKVLILVVDKLLHVLGRAERNKLPHKEDLRLHGRPMQKVVALLVKQFVH